MSHIQLPEGPTPYATLNGSGAALGDIEAGDVIELFKTHGALLLRDFAYDLAGFRAFTGQFCCRFVRNESGKREQVSADGTTQSVNLGREAFPLHPELSRVPWRPDIAWFACAQPPASRGETLVCDGVATAAGLDADTRAYLATRSVLYREETPLGAFTDWLGIPPPDDATLAAFPLTVRSCSSEPRAASSVHLRRPSCIAPCSPTSRHSVISCCLPAACCAHGSSRCLKTAA